MIQVHGTNDVLTQALDKAEHPGRVRGVGAGFTLKTYFTTTEEKKTAREEQADLLREQRAILDLQQSKMSQMEKNQQVLINIVAELRAKLGEKEYSHQDVDSDINIPISPVDEALDSNPENESPKVSKYLYKGCYLSFLQALYILTITSFVVTYTPLLYMLN